MRVRIIVQLVVVAALVTLVSEILKAFAYDVAMQLSVYLGLIITNCILMGRLEAFAMTNNAWDSLLDGLGNGLGYAIILVIVAFVRELFGSASFAGTEIAALKAVRIPLLAQLPIDPALAKECDTGVIELFNEDWMEPVISAVENCPKRKMN